MIKVYDKSYMGNTEKILVGSIAFVGCYSMYYYYKYIYVSFGAKPWW